MLKMVHSHGQVILREMAGQFRLVLSPTSDPWSVLSLYIECYCLSLFGHTLWQCRSVHCHELLSLSVV